MQAGGYPPGLWGIPKDELVIGYTFLSLIALSLFGVLIRIIIGRFSKPTQESVPQQQEDTTQAKAQGGSE